ncbi:hypothetical protein PVAND_004994 [Polypedilum vanderplanki]|uniref:Zinc finger protein n=1 Tax=Polypedilum vanderplanki TaxID=319348 RepID=A0A9J6BZF0_POLVA|nr:hypothetical protein PVAND_004994 [Polypedilum vanderplanki]
MEVDPTFCRVCFTQEENQNYTEILGSSCHVELLSVANIEVFEGDPNMICSRCRIILSNSYKFKQNCKRSENLLKTYPITRKIPQKIDIPQEILPSEIKESNEKEEQEVKEMKSVCVGHELELKESSTQTDIVEPKVTSNACIEQMEMIIANDEIYETAIPCIIAPPTLFEDESANVEQFTEMKEDENKESRKPIILSNEPVKLLNKVDVAAGAPKQFKKTNSTKIDNVVKNTKPKILNAQLKLHQIDSPIIESIETVDGNIEIVTYDNAEYLEEEHIIEGNEKKTVVDDKSQDGVVYTCNVCNRGFPLKQQLEIHSQNHERARDFPCEYCKKAFFTKYDLAKHLLTHTKQKDYTCVVCKKSFSRSTLLYRHEKIHTDPNIPRYHCEHCDRVYLNKLDHEKHQITHNKNRPFACNYCDKRFAFKQGLERHEIMHDTSAMPHKCQYCPERFKTAARLQRHLSASHAGTRAFPCSKCAKRFMLSHHLYRHMRTSHRNADEDITIPCPECDIVFDQRDAFFEHCREHVTVTHICPMCKYKGEDFDDINAHVSLHCKSSMYFCDYCSCIFMTQEVLNEHFIEKHSDELCAIGEEEIEFIVEEKPVAKESNKRTRDKRDDSISVVSRPKRLKQQVQYDESQITGASFVEFEEEITEPIKIDKIKESTAKPVKKGDVSKASPKNSSQTTTTTIQRVKMSQSEIQKLQREGKIIVQDGMFIMKG